MRARRWIAFLCGFCAPVVAHAETPPPPLLGTAGKYPRLAVTLLLQPQFLSTFWNQAGSPNVVEGTLPSGVGPNSVRARADGATTNTTLFRLRRTRVKLVGEMTPYMRGLIEIDVFPVGTGNIFVRNVLATGIAHWGEGVTTDFSAGSFKVPLTSELLQQSGRRPFLERSLVSVAFFPAERDMGAWAQTVVHKKLTIDTAIVNGRTFGEASTGFLPDYNRGKDVVARFLYDFGPAEVGGGWYVGSGSLNAPDGNVVAYRRGALSAEAALHHVLVPALGTTALYTQVTYGQNMDRGVRYAFALPTLPTVPGGDIETKRQLGYWARIEQDVGTRLLLGFRHEVYSNDLALRDNVAQAFGGLASIQFSKGLALRQEYVFGVDHSHAEGQEAPHRVSHTLSTWLQARYD